MNFPSIILNHHQLFAKRVSNFTHENVNRVYCNVLMTKMVWESANYPSNVVIKKQVQTYFPWSKLRSNKPNWRPVSTAFCHIVNIIENNEEKFKTERCWDAFIMCFSVGDDFVFFSFFSRSRFWSAGRGFGPLWNPIRHRYQYMYLSSGTGIRTINVAIYLHQAFYPAKTISIWIKSSHCKTCTACKMSPCLVVLWWPEWSPGARTDLPRISRSATSTSISGCIQAHKRFIKSLFNWLIIFNYINVHHIRFFVVICDAGYMEKHWLC